ncbi:hypothetical protein [Parvibaculum sp.]|uniref:hypothetical protein n=1 Tax=Parvibaculum sp. TaxID=2024848 RepID=UPI00391A49FE
MSCSGDAPLASLNETCFCLPLEHAALEAAAAARLGQDAAAEAGKVLDGLSAGQPLFLSSSLKRDLFARIAAVGATQTALAEKRALASGAAFDREALLAGATFNSYDFHLSAEGPKLIEVNTNAGGAFLQPIFLEAVTPVVAQGAGFEPEEILIDAFARLAPGRALRRLAIVDENPQGQPLYLDMQLAAAAIERRGIAVDVIDRDSLCRERGRLTGPNGPIDMVYNRLVDFLFAEPANAVLRDAWAAGEVAVAPNPDVYRAFACKHILAVLSDPDAVEELAARAHADAALVLDTVPKTEIIDAANAERLWAARDHYVFKPADGYGSRGVYRGDKVTRKKWSEIAAQSYLAQRFAAPSHRVLRLAGGLAVQKADIRVWTHGLKPVFAAARLYGGQVTGFRGEGAGFAPILWIDNSCREAGCGEAACRAAESEAMS